jgi:hypothetical protein
MYSISFYGHLFFSGGLKLIVKNVERSASRTTERGNPRLVFREIACYRCID